MPDVYDDTYLSMDLAPPKRGEPEPQFSRVTKCLRDANGLTIGKASENPILYTRMYEVEYADGEKSSLSANLISEEKNRVDRRRGKPLRAGGKNK